MEVKKLRGAYLGNERAVRWLKRVVGCSRKPRSYYNLSRNTRRKLNFDLPSIVKLVLSNVVECNF